MNPINTSAAAAATAVNNKLNIYSVLTACLHYYRCYLCFVFFVFLIASCFAFDHLGVPEQYQVWRMHRLEWMQTFGELCSFHTLLLFVLFHPMFLPLDSPDDVPLPACLAHHVWRSAHYHADSPEGQSGGPNPETARPAALLPEKDRSRDVLCHVLGRGSGWVHPQPSSLYMSLK